MGDPVPDAEVGDAEVALPARVGCPVFKKAVVGDMDTAAVGDMDALPVLVPVILGFAEVEGMLEGSNVGVAEKLGVIEGWLVGE